VEEMCHPRQLGKPTVCLQKVGKFSSRVKCESGLGRQLEILGVNTAEKKDYSVCIRGHEVC
jgi:hypothetical protein